MNKSSLPIQRLIGPTEENFYQLGLVDEQTCRDNLDHIHQLLRTPWKTLDRVIRELAGQGLQNKLPQIFNWQRVETYSEGCGLPPHEVALAWLIPELTSGLSNWLPGLPPSLFGCSSFFALDSKTLKPIHGRILDFPLFETYSKHEKIIHFDPSKGTQIMGLSTSGLPFPSLTGMSQHKITLALHQKFSNQLDLSGHSVFDISYDYLSKVKNIKEAKKFLKASRPLTTWCFLSSFPTGEVLIADISPAGVHFEQYQLKEQECLYFSNRLLKNTEKSSSPIPYGIDHYNSMREEIAQKKIKKFGKKLINDESLLKMMGSYYNQEKSSSKKWKMGPVTPSSLVIACLNPSMERITFLPGRIPKNYTGELAIVSNCWSNPKITTKKSKTKSTTPDIYQEGWRQLMLSQQSYDLKDFHQSYHHLQLAISFWRGYPEEVIAQFFFYVYQFIHDGHSKIRIQLLKEFNQLQEKLPPYLQDHCLLFIARLEKIELAETTIHIEQIQHPHLKSVFAAEMKVPHLLLHKFVAPLMFPRMDILDILYPYIKA